MYNVYLLTSLLHLEPPAGAVVVVGVAVILQGGDLLHCTVLHCTVLYLQVGGVLHDGHTVHGPGGAPERRTSSNIFKHLLIYPSTYLPTIYSVI